MAITPVNPFDDAEEIAKKSMVLFFVIDCSGSMGGSKIGTVNSVMEELIPEIRGIGGADADIKLAVLKFSGGSEWMYDEPVSVDEFEWKPLDAENVTDLGDAFSALAGKLSRNEFMSSPSLSFAPVMILMSDGYPTDNFEKGLAELQKNKWYAAGIKAAVAIGEDADLDILARFTGNPDSVVTAHNGEALAKLIKFVAVTSSQIGSRSVRLAETDEDQRTKQQSAAEQIREFADSDEISADIEAGW
ncbi:MAG: VWA domain-containing protein [Oscillospiraceae bacterium]|nr:VWA domain-containing protein [Oscillospiraceae bacterium]